MAQSKNKLASQHSVTARTYGTLFLTGSKGQLSFETYITIKILTVAAQWMQSDCYILNTGSPGKPLIFLSEACNAEQIFAPALLTGLFSTTRTGLTLTGSPGCSVLFSLADATQAQRTQYCLVASRHWAKGLTLPNMSLSKTGPIRRKKFTSTLQEPLPTLSTHLQLSHNWSARLAARGLQSVGLPFTSWSYSDLPPFEQFSSRSASINSSVLIWSCLLYVHTSWPALEPIFL